MKKFLGLVALGAVLLAPMFAHAQDATQASIVWSVTGTICEVPNNPGCITFQCNVTAVDTTCHGSTTGTKPPPNLPKMKFAAASATTFGLTFLPCNPCGGTVQCTPLTVSDAQPSAISLTFAAGAFTGSQAKFKAYFPTTCKPCFGGGTPLFTVAWNVSSVGTVSTSTTTVTSTTATTTTVTSTTTTTTL